MNSNRYPLTAAAALCIALASVPSPAAEPAARPPVVAPAPLEPAGVWKWTTPGRNGQPEESVLKLTVEKGQVTGTLADRTGTHPLTNGSLRGNNLTFTIVRDTPNGPVPVDYALTLDGRKPKVSIERPDSTSASRMTGKKRKTEIDVTRTADNPAPKSKD